MVEKELVESNERGFYHVCTDGNCIPWIFKDDLDFIAGVNRIGICKLSTGIDILNYTLMDNHVHFIFHGTYLQCESYLNKYKHLLSKWLKHKYGVSQHLKHLNSQIIPIPDRTALMEIIAYLDRNAIMAGYRFLPSEYRWGAARYFFKENLCCNDTSPAGINSERTYSNSRGENTSNGKDGGSGFRKISDCRKEEIIKIFRTKTIFPGDWQFDENGMLDPRCFLNIRYVESLFRTPLKYIYYLSKKMEGQVELSLECKNSNSFIQDKEMRLIVKHLATTMFNNSDVNTLDIKSRLAIAKKLKYEYASTVKQISRMLHLNAQTLKGFI